MKHHLNIACRHYPFFYNPIIQICFQYPVVLDKWGKGWGWVYGMKLHG